MQAGIRRFTREELKQHVRLRRLKPERMVEDLARGIAASQKGCLESPGDDTEVLVSADGPCGRRYQL